MADTDIEWTDKVWNATRGCSRISPGCGGARGEGGCYAERQAARFCGPGGAYEGLVRIGKQGPRWTGKMLLVADKLAEPLRWRKPRKVFVNSMSDLFHDGLTNEEIAAVFGVMAAASLHTFQVLTKRSKRLREWHEWLAAESSRGYAGGIRRLTVCLLAAEKLGCQVGVTEELRQRIARDEWPLPNVWLGVSVEDQKYADERIPDLLRTPAAVKFVSYEPALGPVNFKDALEEEGYESNGPAGWVQTRAHGIDWIIVGGESGPGARAFQAEWAEQTIEQCRAAGVACFVKQMGSNPHIMPQHCRGWVPMHLKDRKGGAMEEWPEHLRVREFPR